MTSGRPTTDATTTGGDERAADRRADRRMLALIAALTMVSLVVTALTRQTEAMHRGSGETPVEIWLLEASSHIVIVALACLGPLLINRVGFSWTHPARAAPVLLAGWLAFTFMHVGAMHLIRALLFPLLLRQPYVWRALEGPTLAYEGLKDLFVFLLLVIAFLLGRSIAAAQLEQRQRVSAAQSEQKILLRSGASSYVAPARDIVWARAAGNYAEVHMANRTVFARVTFAGLEQMLAAAGGRHVRIHRSHIVNLDHVVAVEPTGEGDVRVRLSTGEELPGSRRYRANLERLAPPADG